MKKLFAIVFSVMLAGCGADRSDNENPYTIPSKAESAQAESDVLGADALEAIRLGELAKSMSQLGSVASSNGQQRFHGYPCTADCSGHTAGYEWAEEQGIEDIDDCTGNSQSFIEGCHVYVEENAESEDEDDEEGD